MVKPGAKIADEQFCFLLVLIYDTPLPRAEGRSFVFCCCKCGSSEAHSGLLAYSGAAGLLALLLEGSSCSESVWSCVSFSIHGGCCAPQLPLPSEGATSPASSNMKLKWLTARYLLRNCPLQEGVALVRGTCPPRGSLQPLAGVGTRPGISCQDGTVIGPEEPEVDLVRHTHFRGWEPCPGKTEGPATSVRVQGPVEQCTPGCPLQDGPVLVPHSSHRQGEAPCWMGPCVLQAKHPSPSDRTPVCVQRPWAGETPAEGGLGASHPGHTS